MKGPIDVVVFEGWMVGFGSRDGQDLTREYEEARMDPEKYARSNLDYQRPVFVEHRLQDLLFINERLRNYEDRLWSLMDCFVQLKPEDMSYVWEWRLQVSRRRSGEHLRCPGWTR